jgi:hypothetical protein
MKLDGKTFHRLSQRFAPSCKLFARGQESKMYRVSAVLALDNYRQNGKTKRDFSKIPGITPYSTTNSLRETVILHNLISTQLVKKSFPFYVTSQVQ